MMLPGNPGLRAVISETMDPDGAMFRFLSPDLEQLGYEVLRVPTQQAIRLLGPREYQQLLVEIAHTFRPHVMFVHPPYDYLSLQTAAAIRQVGVRLVGFAFDDSIFLPMLRASGQLEAAARDIHEAFDLLE